MVWNRLKWVTIVAIAVALFATYGSLYLQITTLTNVFITHAPRLALALLLLIAGKAFLELTSPLFTNVIADTNARRFAQQLYRYLVWLGAGAAITFTLVGDFSSILVAFGLVGFGVAFALQRPILSFTGWVHITLKQLYRIGDRIEVNGLRGDVIEVDLFTTALLEASQSGAWTGKHISFPNSLILEQPLTNATKEGAYLWDTISLRLDPASDFDQVRKALLTITDDVIGNKKMAEAWRHIQEDLLHHGLRAEGESPEINLSNDGKNFIVEWRYLVPPRMRAAVKTTLLEHLWAETHKNKAFVFASEKS